MRRRPTNSPITAADNYSLSSHALPRPSHLVILNPCRMRNSLIGLALLVGLLEAEGTRPMSTKKRAEDIQLRTVNGNDANGDKSSWRENEELENSSNLELSQRQRISVKGIDWISAMTFWDTRHEAYMTGCVVCKHGSVLDRRSFLLRYPHRL